MKHWILLLAIFWQGGCGNEQAEPIPAPSKSPDASGETESGRAPEPERGSAPTPEATASPVLGCIASELAKGKDLIARFYAGTEIARLCQTKLENLQQALHEKGRTTP